jgi:NADH-quinone oxidoreductase subunit J
MHDALFYVFSAAALIFALLVIANPFSRNAVTSAMFLVLTIGSIAGLFVLLEAYFLAAVQVLVYAGAVMVLFLFVIMLLDLKAEERRGLKGWTRKVSFAIAALSVAVLLYFMFRSFHQSALHRSDGTIEGATAPLGRLLFTQYLLPFEIVSVLLLVAMIGVILLSKRDVQ